MNAPDVPIQTAQVNNFQMAYREKGQGLPLVFIHGFPFTGQMWLPQLEGLADMYRVIAPDLRGHGSSGTAPGPYWMDLMADDIARFMDAIGINQPVVMCGLSMGGYIAMSFFRTHSPRLAGLILAATRAEADSGAGRSGREANITKIQEGGIEQVIEGMLPKLFASKTYQQNQPLVDWTREMMRQVPPQAAINDLMGMKERPDSTETLATDELPTLILYGDDDKIIPAADAEQMHVMIRSSHLQKIHDAGHLLNLEQPDEFNEAVVRYLEVLPRPGSTP